jgi:hypothetical protein
MNQIDLNQLLEEVKVNQFIPYDTRSAAFCEVVQNCLHLDPAHRVPAAVLFDSPLFGTYYSLYYSRTTAYSIAYTTAYTTT